MNVLIVDDNEPKRAHLIEWISKQDTHGSVKVDEASTMADAVRCFNSNKYDFIVLDLMLPAFAGVPESSSAGLELLMQLRKETCINVKTPAFGISAYPDEIDSNRARYEQHGLLLVSYDDDGLWKLSLKEALDFAGASGRSKRDIDFLIFASLKEEADAFKNTALRLKSKSIINGLKSSFVELASGGQELSGVIIEASQMGLVNATYEIATALSTFESKLACMSGICAGFKNEVELGQILVASPCWEYQAGKWSDNGFEIAPLQIPLPARTRTIIDQALSEPGWVGALEVDLPSGVLRPRNVNAGILRPFVTGSAVISDANKLPDIGKQHRKVAALDMEAYALYYVCHESASPSVHYFAAKVVVDFADFDKSDDIHEYGCTIAARATIALILRLLR